MFTKIAVTKEQRDDIDRGYELETRATKDSAHGMADEFGESVEVDAMPTQVLRAMVRNAIESRIDIRAWRRVAAYEREGQARLDRGLDELRDELRDEGWLQARKWRRRS